MSDDGKTHCVLLLLEDNPADAQLAKEYLADDPLYSFEVHHASRLTEGLALMSDLEIDVVLFDLGIPDSTDPVDSIKEIKGRLDDAPILVLTGLEEEGVALSCMEAGAQDYLMKAEVTERGLRRAIGYALARRMDAQAELNKLRLSIAGYRAIVQQGTASSVTAHSVGLGPLSERRPETFRAVVGEYCQLLRSYVIDRPSEGHHVREAMERVVTIAGDFGGGPRDVVELHTTALEELAPFSNARQHDALIVEGRLFALEMMGMLVDYYRTGHRRYFASRSL